MRTEPSTAKPLRLPGRLLPRAFFERPPEVVAPLLLGKILVRKTKGQKLLAGRIVEVEAYLGPHHDPPDAAAHAHRGLTPRNAVLFGPAGHAYVYAIYGMHFCMNISCEAPGRAGSVLLRALEPMGGMDEMARNRRRTAGEQPLSKSSARGGAGLKQRLAPRELTGGPSRLCQALGITRPRHNGMNLLDARSELQVREDGFAFSEYVVTPRIGIRHAADRLLRFALPDHPCVSGPKSLPSIAGKRVCVG